MRIPHLETALWVTPIAIVSKTGAKIDRARHKIDRTRHEIDRARHKIDRMRHFPVTPRTIQKSTYVESSPIF